MSINPVLRARQGQFSITSIDGKRCTAVPREGGGANNQESSSTSSTTTQPPPETTSTQQRAPPATTSSQPPEPPPIIAASPSPPPDTQEVASIPTTSASPPPAAEANNSALPALRPSSSEPARPASKATTPTSSSSTSQADAQSDSLPLSTVSQGSVADTATPLLPASPTPAPVTPPADPPATEAAGPAPEPVVGTASASTSVNAGLIAGGVIGSVALVAIVGLLLWYCRRRRKGRNSLLTSLNTDKKDGLYVIENGSLGPTKRTEKLRSELSYRVGSVKGRAAEVATFFKTKARRESDSAPSVNMNRGNSQFLDGSTLQHSRNSSSALSGQSDKVSTKDNFEDWWGRFTDKVLFKRKTQDMEDPFLAAQRVAEKERDMPGNMPRQPDFSQLLAMDEKNPQDPRRSSLSGPTMLQLYLDNDDPFEDLYEDHSADINSSTGSKRITGQSLPRRASSIAALNSNGNSNPFADPIAQPAAARSNSQSYVANVRRSRGQSISALPTRSSSTNRVPNATYGSQYRKPGEISRYPSTIAPTHDSGRDTLFSSYSLATARRGKGRSDPFDLDRPDFTGSQTSLPLSENATTSQNMSAYQATNSHLNMGQGNGNKASHYVSGTSSLGDWGDPGPDLGSTGRSSGEIYSSAKANVSTDAITRSLEALRVGLEKQEAEGRSFDRRKIQAMRRQRQKQKQKQ